MASIVMRKKLKSTKQDGLALYDRNGRQIVNGTPLTRPSFPQDKNLDFPG